MEKALKFYTCILTSMYGTLYRDKKRSTTFFNKIKKLYPEEKVEKLFDLYPLTSKVIAKYLDRNGVLELLEWGKSTCRSKTQEIIFSGLISDMESFKVSASKKEVKKEITETPELKKEVKETPEVKAKIKEPIISEQKEMESSKIDYNIWYFFHSLWQFVKNDKRRKKQFTNIITNLNWDETKIIIENLDNSNYIFPEVEAIDIVHTIMEYIEKGLRSKVQTLAFNKLKEEFQNFLNTSKIEVEGSKKNEIPAIAFQKGKFKIPVRVLDYGKIIKQNKKGKLTYDMMLKLNKPIKTLKLNKSFDEIKEDLFTTKYIQSLVDSIVDYEISIIEEACINVLNEEILAFSKFIWAFEKSQAFKDRLISGESLIEKDYLKIITTIDDPISKFVYSRKIWFEILICISLSELPLRQRKLVDAFIIPNFFDYIDTISNIDTSSLKVVSVGSDENKISWYISSKYINITLGSSVHNIYYEDESFQFIKDKINDNINDIIDEQTLIDALKSVLIVEKSQEEVIKELPTWIKEDNDFKIVDNTIVIKGIILKGTQVNDLINMIKNKNKAGMLSLKNFLVNLSKNPSETAKNELYEFCIKNGLPITPAGTILMYKWVQNDYLDAHSRTMLNKPGVIVWQKREDCDLDSKNSCSSGLHLASYGYGKFSNKLIVAELNPAHCIAVPDRYANNKLRTTAYKLLLETTEYEDNKSISKSKDFLTQIAGHHNPNILEKQIMRYFGNEYERKFSPNPKVKKIEDVDLFFKPEVIDDKILVNKKIKKPEIYESFKVKIGFGKYPELSKERAMVISNFLTKDSSIDFNVDEVNSFIHHEIYDFHTLYELIKAHTTDELTENFFYSPESIRIAFENKSNFKAFMYAWKKLIQEFISIADISEKDYTNSKIRGSSIIEVSDFVQNTDGDLIDLKRKWADLI